MKVARACPGCGKALAEGEQPCASCGTYACQTCGAKLQPSDRFCGRCGTPKGSGAGAAPTMLDAAGEVWDEVLASLRAATIGEFVVGTELGRGGMATVYLAHDIALNRKVAIKVMAPGLLTGKGMVERFRQEAVTVANLNHPHIVTIHAVRQASGLHFFVLQLVAGRSLDLLIRDTGPLPLPVVQAIMFQVASALNYAHRRGVIHRDVKPSNILMDDDGNAVVTDFGIAKVVEVPSQTQTGTTVGTPAYMSPEQCWSREVTGASDQYSLGVVAYELLTGAPPFTGPTLNILRAHTEDAPPPVRASRPDCPPEIEAALMRMLAKAPTDRWPTVMQAVEALGARALGETDPVRQTLITLSQRSAGQPSLTELRTPRSPIPSRPSPALPDPSSDALTLFPGPALTVSAPAPSLPVGEAMQLTLFARTTGGAPTEAPPVTWTSSDPAVATVSNAGMVWGTGVGSVVVRARSAEGSTGSVRLQIVPPAVVSSPAVDPEPRRYAVEVGASAAVPPLAEPVPAAPAGPGAGAAVDRKWVKVAAPALVLAAGVLAWLLWPGPEPPDPAFRLRVTPADLAITVGDSATLSGELTDETGAVVREAVTWFSGDTVVARVSAGGMVTGIRPGATSVTGASRGARAEARVTVSAPSIASVASVELRPPQLDLAVGGSASLRAVVRDEAGGVLTGRTVEWMSSNPASARVSRSGIVTGVAAGQATITATSEEVPSEGVPVTVSAPVAVRYATLQMLIAPWAYVIIDGQGKGQRVRGEDRLTAGVPHRIRFERSGFVTVDTTIVLEPDERRLLRIQLKAR